MINNLSVVNVYEKKNLKSKIVTQLLYGDTFKRLEKFGSWLKIINNLDTLNFNHFTNEIKVNNRIITINLNLGKTLDDYTITQLIEDSGYSIRKIIRD